MSFTPPPLKGLLPPRRRGVGKHHDDQNWTKTDRDPDVEGKSLEHEISTHRPGRSDRHAGVDADRRRQRQWILGRPQYWRGTASESHYSAATVCLQAVIAQTDIEARISALTPSSTVIRQ
jgi:hypothetical protein